MLGTLNSLTPCEYNFKIEISKSYRFILNLINPMRGAIPRDCFRTLISVVTMSKASPCQGGG